MRETSARLLRLLSLLQARPDWAGPELARRLEITPRTLRRDVQRLRDLGYPVTATPGAAGGLPPPGGALPAAAATVDPDLLTALARACRGREVLTFGYVSRDGTATQRRAEPYRLVQAGHPWYPLARDTERDDWRTLRVDRLSGPARTGSRFTRVDPPDAAAFVANSVTTAQYRFRARILVHAPIQAVAEQVPPTTGMLTADGPDRCLLVTGADSLDLMAFHLARLDADVTILEPPELIARTRQLAARLTRSTSTAVGAPGAPGQPGPPAPPPHPAPPPPS